MNLLLCGFYLVPLNKQTSMVLSMLDQLLLINLYITHTRWKQFFLNLYFAAVSFSMKDEYVSIQLLSFIMCCLHMPRKLSLKSNKSNEIYKLITETETKRNLLCCKTKFALYWNGKSLALNSSSCIVNYSKKKQQKTSIFCNLAPCCQSLFKKVYHDIVSVSFQKYRDSIVSLRTWRYPALIIIHATIFAISVKLQSCVTCI
jgi:hypothetical protein